MVGPHGIVFEFFSLRHEIKAAAIRAREEESFPSFLHPSHLAHTVLSSSVPFFTTATAPYLSNPLNRPSKMGCEAGRMARDSAPQSSSHWNRTSRS
ncbi:hypothetical protein D9757_011699 [Collybiopsis confluens]|uniref:Uncharacterized protein n=1 Tax=Collybiopsis confluens TaxID=2823264 RepID=A0A8H5GLQ5_9AGAR|nr:hypothetical protein D9757_011699 [Collybiopsis confluens]